MSVYFITGKLGGGKNLVSVGKIRDYLLAGKKVATNLDLNLEYLLPRHTKKCEIYRIPDKPKIEDFDAIGYGSASTQDSDYGLLVLDELGTWLNSRTFQKDKGRQAVIDWFLHARHYRWDVLLIVQDPELIDKQIRISMGEHIVICRRTDRLPLPVIGSLVKLLTGVRFKLPRVHVGSVFYGAGRGAIKVDTWVYRGIDLFPAYNTFQIFEDNDNRIAQFIPPAYLDQRRFTKKNLRFYMRLTKIHWKRLKSPVAFFFGLTLNFLFLFVFFTFFNTSESQALVPTEIDQVKNDFKKTDDMKETTVINKKNLSSVVTKLVPVSYIQTSDFRGKIEIQYIYDDVFYTAKNFPVPIKWINRKPFCEVVVDEADNKKSKSKSSSLLSSLID